LIRFAQALLRKLQLTRNAQGQIIFTPQQFATIRSDPQFVSLVRGIPALHPFIRQMALQARQNRNFVLAGPGGIPMLNGFAQTVPMARPMMRPFAAPLAPRPASPVGARALAASPVVNAWPSPTVTVPAPTVAPVPQFPLPTTTPPSSGFKNSIFFSLLVLIII
jgi:hypothetical protein